MTDLDNASAMELFGLLDVNVRAFVKLLRAAGLSLLVTRCQRRPSELGAILKLSTAKSVEVPEPDLAAKPRLQRLRDKVRRMLHMAGFRWSLGCSALGACLLAWPTSCVVDEPSGIAQASQPDSLVRRRP